MGRSINPNPFTALVVCGLLLLAVVLVFGQTLSHKFVNYDDNEYICENLPVACGLTADGLVWAFTNSLSGNWHPLTWFSHMLDCQFYGLNAGGHHLTNVLLHAVNASLLFLVLRRMTGGLWLSAFVAAVFAIHPLRVESVAWAAERKDVLSGLFFMLTLGAYIGYVSRSFSLIRYLAVVILFALGLMCKPMPVTLPFVLLLLDYWPLGRYNKGGAAGLIVEKIPLLALAAVSCGVALFAQQQAFASLDYVPLSARIANALVSYAAYLKLFFYPAGLAVLYPHPVTDLANLPVIVASLVLAAICLTVLFWRRRRPWLFVGWLWYLGMLVPVIGVVQVGEQALADRYTYLPQIGLCLALAWEAAEAVRCRLSRRALCAVASVLAALSLMGCAWHQTTYWRDDETLWRRALACTTQNATAHYNLGNALRCGGQIDEAIVHYRASLEINPHYAKVHNNLGIALASRGRIDEALACYQRALEIEPDYAEAYYNYGNVLARRRQFEKAIICYRRALDVKPDYAAALNNLAGALVERGQFYEAISHYRKALEIQPAVARSHYNLAHALVSRGQVEEGIAHYRKALEMQPHFAEAHNNLGGALASCGRISEAIAHYRQALEIQADADVCNNLALLLATCPEASLRNGQEAVALARRAVQLSDASDADILDTLAAAYAEMGQFSKAIETAEQAISLASSRGDTGLADIIRARLKLYQAGAPYHESRRPPAK